MKLSIIIPAHNEEDNITEVINRVEGSLDIPHELVVVNDHSTDDTRKILEGLAQKNSAIKVVENNLEKGFANALRTGFSNANTDIVVPVMADLSDDLSTINAMFRKINEGYDVVCGSRYMKGGARQGGYGLKGFLSYFAGRSLKILLNLPTHDISNAFKMYRKKVIDSIDIKSAGFEISIEIPLKAYFLGFKITEVATVWKERTKGKSSFRMFRLLPNYFKLYLWALLKRMTKYLDYIIYWSIVLIPFSMSISPAMLSIFEGFLSVSFLAKKALKRERIFTATAINIPLLLLFIVTCLSVFHSINYGDSFKGGIFKLARYALVFFILVEELKDEKHIKRIIFSIGAGILLASFDGIWQVLTGRDFIRGYAPVINIGLVRATAAFKDSNTFGIYLSALAPLIFGLTLYYFRRGKKAGMLVFSSLAMAGILLTYSRPTLLAIYLALFFLGVARNDRKMVAFLVIFLLIAPFILPKSVKNWAKEVEYNPLRFMCNDDRIAVYRNSLNMIKDHPFIGLGANTYMKNYKKYREPVEYRNIVTKDYMYAHNNFLHMAAEIGLIGLGIFLWLLYKLFKECKHIYKRLDSHYFKIVSLSLAACLIAFLVNGLTESSLYYSRVAIIFWYLAGLSLALNKFIDADKLKSR